MRRARKEKIFWLWMGRPTRSAKPDGIADAERPVDRGGDGGNRRARATTAIVFERLSIGVGAAHDPRADALDSSLRLKRTAGGTDRDRFGAGGRDASRWPADGGRASGRCAFSIEEGFVFVPSRKRGVAA